VKVSLYKTVKLDTALVRINQLYPNIGVEISQETEFDPRENTADYSTLTDALGNWNIQDIAEDDYNVVVEKDSFGWQIAYNQKTGHDMVFSLKKMRTYTGNQSGLIEFENDFIDVPANTSFEVNSQVFFAGTNYILLSNGANIHFRGVFGEDPDTRIFILNSSPGSISTVEFNQQLNLQLNGIYTGPGVQIRLSNCDYILSGSIIRGDVSDACRISQSDGVLENNIFQRNAGAVNISETFLTTVRNNIFLQDSSDLEIFAADSLLIEDNLFRQGEVNLSLVRTNGLVQYNNFEGSVQNIEIADLSNLDISHNSMVLSENNIRLNRMASQNDLIDLIASMNNFAETGFYAFYLEDHSVRVPVLAKNNFWDTNIKNQIEEKIFDKYDVPGYNTEQYVIFEPFIINPIADAGIR
jgi:hypothetical protein